MSVPADDGSPEPEDQARSPRRRRLIRVLIATAAAVVLLVGGATGLFLERQRAYDQNIQRIPGAFPAEPGRPARAPGGAQN
jgi:hypothetical protein